MWLKTKKYLQLEELIAFQRNNFIYTMCTTLHAVNPDACFCLVGVIYVEVWPPATPVNYHVEYFSMWFYWAVIAIGSLQAVVLEMLLCCLFLEIQLK